MPEKRWFAIAPERLKALLYHYAVAMGAIAIVVFVYRRLPVNPDDGGADFSAGGVGSGQPLGTDGRNDDCGGRDAGVQLLLSAAGAYVHRR